MLNVPIGLSESPHAAQSERPALHAGHYAQIASSSRAILKARKADRVAGFSGIAILLGGLVFLPFSLGSGFGIALGIALIVIGWRELALRKDVRSLDPLGFGRLARNQVALAVVLTGYGISRLVGPVPTMDSVNTAGLGGMADDLDQTVQRIALLSHYGVGGGIIFFAWLVQGGQAVYYARVGRSVRKAHARFPVWVMRVHAASWGGRVPAHAGEPDAPVAPSPNPASDDENTPQMGMSAA